MYAIVGDDCVVDDFADVVAAAVAATAAAAVDDGDKILVWNSCCLRLAKVLTSFSFRNDVA